MSTDALERGLSMVREHPGSSTFVGPRSELFVRSAEQALGLCFPPSYRRFALELGAGNVGSREIFGVVDVDFELSMVPDAVWATMAARDEGDLPLDLVVIGIRDEELVCLQIMADGREGPVLLLVASGDERGSRLLAPDFGSYFREAAESQLKSG